MVPTVLKTRAYCFTPVCIKENEFTGIILKITKVSKIDNKH